MLNNHEKQKYLDKILNSQDFYGCKILQTYLTYLAEAARKGKELKETTIAQEVFEKDENFNPVEDTIVRSNTYHLRKKLESYYKGEGKEDPIKLEIRKGRYEAHFTSNSGSRTSRILTLIADFKNYELFAITLLFVVVLLLFLQVRALKSRYEIIDKNNPIWREYLKSDLPILIVPGNHFFFNDFIEKYDYEVGIRHGRINTREDFNEFIVKNSNNYAYEIDEPYFPHHSVWSLPPILSLFFSVNQKPILRKSSALVPQMLDEYNIIFVGSIKTLYILRHTLSKSNFNFQISPHKIIYSPSDSNSTDLFAASLHSPGPNDDLVLAVKLPGPKKNCIFLIASFHSLGAAEVANYLVERDTREYVENVLREKYNRVPKYFEILFRVQGIDKTAYNTEILVCNEISED